VIKQAHKILTDKARSLDAALLEGLERVGFRLDFGENGTGWPLKYRTRGGGYYFNIGCSELLIRGEIRLIQYHDIAAMTPTGITMTDGRALTADLAVLATGYKGPDHMIDQFFGPHVAAKVGQVWGFDDHQELSNMWAKTAQPGLWFTGGSFSQCRMYSPFLAMQIKAGDLGLADAQSGLAQEI
jgi:putative flavoprotein involved in K+ transport